LPTVQIAKLIMFVRLVTLDLFWTIIFVKSNVLLLIVKVVAKVISAHHVTKDIT
jgi:hypothetical protein